MSLANILTKWSKKSPNKLAITDGIKSSSFSELESQSNKMSNHLISLGVKKGSKVIVVTDKSVDFLVTIFGVMKAGATYVPIDPDISDERFTVINKEVKPSGIIGNIVWTYESKANQFFINYDKLETVLKDVSDDGYTNPNPMDIAYTMYNIS